MLSNYNNVYCLDSGVLRRSDIGTSAGGLVERHAKTSRQDLTRGHVSRCELSTPPLNDYIVLVKECE